MSRESLLDEAITKAKECEDWQLVEWLRMARGGENAARWYSKKLLEERAENDRLRSCLTDAAENARLIMGENAKLREERDTYRDLVGMMDHPDLNAQLQAENAKLRELARDMWRDGMCECDERGACAECEYHYTDRMRELGVEP